MTANGAHGKSLPQASIERPRLLPSNRKLRHLQGISLRNLHTSPLISRHRSRTIDDDALPTTHRSPVQLLDAQQTSKLVHSRSHSDLKPRRHVQDIPEDSITSNSEPKQEVAKRTPLRKPRRRSTLDWNFASPRQRQLRLEESISTRVADVFYSLHVVAVKEPIYISEVIENTMNPNFRFFDMSLANPALTRLDHITIRFWSRPSRSGKWQLLIESPISLKSLRFIGRDLEYYPNSLPINCILLHLSDGLYMPTDFTSDPDSVVELNSLSSTPHFDFTSSYDALMRLSTLDDCIQDAIAIREKVTAEISSLLQDPTKTSPNDRMTDAKDSLLYVRAAVAKERKLLSSMRRSRDSLLTSLQSRRRAIQKGNEAHELLQDDLHQDSTKLQECQVADRLTIDDITGQRRRVCEDLLQIYPIEAIPNKPLSFTIRGLFLPNSTFDHVKDEDAIAAALGMVAHLVYLLSFYLSMPLPYPIQPYASASLITDPISLMAGSHVFPLYLKGNVLYRFEYGVFLLNKNIELLSAKLGLTVMDIRQTLPNLKYLLYVATAGKGELPLRRAGGVRAFLRDSSIGSVASSRRGSDESGHMNRVESLRKQALSNGSI